MKQLLGRGMPWLPLMLALLNIGAFVANYLGKPVLWDHKVYLRALQDLSTGLNPYRADAHDLFVYPPAVLDAFAAWPVPLFNAFLLALGLISLWSFWATWRPSNPQASHSTPLHERAIAWTCAIGFGGLGVFVFATGNVTPYLHFAVLASAHAWLVRQPHSTVRLLVFCGVLLLTTLVKPYFAAYAFVPMLLTRWQAGATLAGAVTLAMALATYAGYWLWDQPRMLQFLEAVHHQTQGKSDLGFAFFGLLHQAGCSTLTAGLVHAVLLGLLAWVCWRSALRLSRLGHTDQALALLCTLAVLANPRLKEYDLFPLVTLWLLTFWRRSALSDRALLACIALASVALPFKVLHLQRSTGWGAYLGEAKYWEFLAMLAMLITVMPSLAAIRHAPGQSEANSGA